MSKRDPSTANTKVLLIERLDFEASALIPAEKEMEASFSNFATMTPGQRKDAVEKANALTNIRARVERVLAQDESSEEGTRNSAGGTIKAVMKATGRNMLAEGRAAHELINRYDESGVDLHDEAVFRGIVEAFGGSEE